MQSTWQASGIIVLQASEDVLDLLSRMVAFDPARRISAADALEHRYFRSQPPPTLPAQLPRPALRHPAPGLVSQVQYSVLFFHGLFLLLRILYRLGFDGDQLY